MQSKTQLLERETERTPEAEHTQSNGTGSAIEPATRTAIRREQIFEILSNERRRLVLRYLQTRSEDERVGFRELVDQVAAWENDATIQEVDSSDRKCVYTALRQTHLPKLDTFDVIEYDHQRGTLEPNENIDEVLTYMEYSPERESFWNRVNLLLAAVCGVSLLFLVGGVIPFGSPLQLAVAIGVASAFGVSSFVRLYRTERVQMPGTYLDR